MPVNFHTYERTFFLGAGTVDLKITYATDEFQQEELDFDVINIAELSHGYEDDDQLTFYPNVLTITCDDFSRKNYNILKYATQSRPPITKLGETILPSDWTNGSTRDLDKYFGIELKLNNKLLFKGFIDRNKIEYTYRDGTLTFGCLDYTVLLKQQNYNFDYYQSLDPFNWFGPIQYLHSIFRYIYPDLPVVNHPNQPLTNNLNTFENMTLGYYFKHNWLFYCGNEQYQRSWDMNIDLTGWYHVAFYMPLLKAANGNLAADARGLAHNIGCIVGSDVYNKIYCFKRFLTPSEIIASNPIELLENVHVIEYDRYMHLGQIRAVRNITKSNSIIFWQGESNFPRVKDTNESAPAFPEYQLDIQTDFEPTMGEGGFQGESTFRDREPFPNQQIMNGIYDPSFVNSPAYINQIITNWYYESRKKNRDRIEMELWGVDYRIFHLYKYQYLPNQYLYMRPMTLKRELVNNKTDAVFIEMAI